jgi:hypothetical protein
MMALIIVLCKKEKKKGNEFIRGFGEKGYWISGL